MKKRNKNKNIKILALAGLLCLSLGSANANQDELPLKNKVFETFEGIKLRGGVKIDNSEQLITLNLVNSDLRQVLRMLADKAKMNIMMHDSVEGNITLDLVDVPLNKAFEYIMTMNNLSYRQDDNTLIIATSDTANELNLNISELKPLKVKYIAAQKAANFLNSNIFTLNNPNTNQTTIATANPSTNEVLIFGNDSDVKIAEKVLNYIDVPPAVNSYTVNYADPIGIASKICWTVFKSEDGETTTENEAEQSEGSESSIVCGTPAGEESQASDGGFTSLDSPSYWVLADTGLNQITIYGGTQEQLVMAKNLIKEFDKKEPQVYLEISIIELSEAGSKALSNIIALHGGTQTVVFTNGTTQLESANRVIRSLPGLQGADSIFNNFDVYGNSRVLAHTIQAIIKDQKGRVISNPRIIAANNTQSEIDISQDNISSITTQINDQTGVKTTEVNIGSDQGIQLSILPKITPNGYVILTVEPTFNTLKERLTAQGNDVTATLLNRRAFKAKNLRVKDRETLVIGGLIQETETNNQDKVPILGDLPIVGVLFKNQNTVKERSELVLMITPRILYDEDDKTAL